MNTILRIFPIRQAFVFAGTALIVWSFISFPERSLLMRSLSTLTIAAFFLLLGQFTCTQKAHNNSTAQSICNLFKLHNTIGYSCLAVVILHPLFLVVPKIKGNTLSPGDALLTILSNVSSSGVVAGMVAWFAVVLVGAMSYFRRQLALKYTTWKSIHTGLALTFTIAAVYHVLHLSRHASIPMTSFVVIFASCGCFAYFIGIHSKVTHNTKNIQL